MLTFSVSVTIKLLKKLKTTLFKTVSVLSAYSTCFMCETHYNSSPNNAQTMSGAHPRLEEMIIDIEQSWQRDANIHHWVKDEAGISIDKIQPDTALFQVLHQECWAHHHQPTHQMLTNCHTNSLLTVCMHSPLVTATFHNEVQWHIQH